MHIKEGGILDKKDNTKRNYVFLLEPTTSDLINSHLGASGLTSRSQFVERAVKLYCHTLDGKEDRLFFDEEIVTILRAIVRESEARLSSHLRSMDISLSILSVLFAANLAEMTNEDIAVVRRDAIRYVDENRRARSVVTALREQRGDE